MNDGSTNELQNWHPYKLVNRSPDYLCEWMYMGAHPFKEPFFDDTIAACKNLSENRNPFRVYSGLEMMKEWGSKITSNPPAAIIFHISRCGSTLLSQLLSLDERNIVLAEVPLFDALLRLPFQYQAIAQAQALQLLASAIKFYGRSRPGKENQLIIKTDSWHLHFYEQYRQLYPDVPMVFLYRNPLEVLVSQQRQRGMHSVQGIIEPAVFGFTEGTVHETNLDAYLLKVLEGYFTKMIAISNKDNRVMLLNYNEGFPGIMKKISSIPGMESIKDLEDVFAERILFHAKHPQQIFQADKLLTEVPPAALPVMQLYNELDELRILNAG